MSKAIDKIKTESSELYAKLKTERDELNVKASLVKLEMKEAWEGAETKWESFQNKYHIIVDSVDDALDDVADGFMELGREIKHAYKDIRKGINSAKDIK